MIRRPPRSTLDRSSAASDVYKRQHPERDRVVIVDGSSLSVAATISDVPSFTYSPQGTAGPGHLQPAVDESLNKLYVLVSRQHKVDVFDGNANYAYLRTLDLSSQQWGWSNAFADHVIFADSSRHRLHIGPILIDTTTDTVTGLLAAGRGSIVVDLDAANHRLLTLDVATTSAQATVRGGGHSTTLQRRTREAAERAALAAREMLPEDIQKKIDELLAAIKSGELSADAARLKVDEIRALLDKLNTTTAEEAKRQAEAAKDAQPGGEKPNDDEGDKLTKKAEELADSSAGLPEDVRWSIDDLASRLANSDASKRETNKENAAASEKTGEKGAGSDEAAKAEMAQAAGMQMVREAAADAAEGQMMNGGGGAMGGDSRPGAGGNQGGNGLAEMAALKQALRQEMIQAQADLLGQTVDTEIRRKTEQSQAKVGFTRVALSLIQI